MIANRIILAGDRIIIADPILIISPKISRQIKKVFHASYKLCAELNISCSEYKIATRKIFLFFEWLCAATTSWLLCSYLYSSSSLSSSTSFFYAYLFHINGKVVTIIDNYVNFRCSFYVKIIHCNYLQWIYMWITQSTVEWSVHSHYQMKYRMSNFFILLRIERNYIFVYLLDDVASCIAESRRAKSQQ